MHRYDDHNNGDNLSRISTCLDAAPHFLLSGEEAIEIAERLIVSIADNWAAVCEEAVLTPVDRELMWGRQFLNPYAFEGLTGDAGVLSVLAAERK